MRNVLFVAGLIAGLPALAAQVEQRQRPLLEQLSSEVQALYDSVAEGIVEVRLPARWMDPAFDPDLLRRWERGTEPRVRPRLRRELEVVPWEQLYLDGVMRDDAQGLLVDDDGHLLLPRYVAREAVADERIAVIVGRTTAGWARFVGSDRQAGLTVLRLEQPAGRPVRLAETAPPPGALVLMLRRDDARLAVWTDRPQEPGIAVTMDGSVAGFVQRGRFISAAALAPAVRQLIAHGQVHRAVLGVLVVEVRPHDPVRRQVEVLGARPAVRVQRVLDDSPAERAGVREGDLILQVDGQPVRDQQELAALIWPRTGEIELQVLRGDEVRQVIADLGE